MAVSPEFVSLTLQASATQPHYTTPGIMGMVQSYFKALLTMVLAIAPLKSHDDPKVPDIQRPTARMIRTQLVIAFVLGFINFITFCVLRCKWPKLYSARLLRRKGLPQLPKSSFIRWIKVISQVNETQVLEHAGLDAFVFLSFFKMAIRLLAACAFFGFFIISPIRYHYTGGYDQGDGDNINNSLSAMADDILGTAPEEYEGYLWMYVVFTYTFTIIVVWCLFRQTKHVLSIRQEYLGKQNSVTDRTIRLSGIPADLRDEERLGKHIELLNIGKVLSVTICREWKPLNNLFKQRRAIIIKLEKTWSKYLKPFDIGSRNFTFEGIDNGIFALSSSKGLNSGALNKLAAKTKYSDNEEENSVFADDNLSENIENIVNGLARNETNHGDNGDDDPDEEAEFLNRRIIYSNNQHNIDDANSTISAGLINLAQNQLQLKRPKINNGYFGIFGKQVDAIDYLTNQLHVVDEEIRKARYRYYPATPTAFITMESVASAQMVAQAVLDPHANYLTTKLAPAPHDVMWDNVCLSRKERIAKSYYITVIITIVSVALIFPVSYLATLLNVKTISKFFPELGEFLKAHKQVESFVTGLLPTYIFTLLNVIIPFFYVKLSSMQGFISHGEEELSIVSKNFFYLFVNLFLVFTLAGTASNYWSFLSDTTQIAKQLATSLKDLSLFYVDLIIFQGIGMFPFKLLLFGSVVKFPFFYTKCTTPREFKKLYKPPVFNFGLALPQPVLILIITIIYSVMSTKILVSGLIYFIIGYYVYKYQLMYLMVHPPHSTGKVWPLVFRRIILGLLIFQLTMAGLLALQNGFVLAFFLAPLPFITIGFLYDFQKHYVPLSFFIALRSIKQNDEEAQGQTAHYLDDPESLVEDENRNAIVHNGKTALNPNEYNVNGSNGSINNELVEDIENQAANNLEPSVSLASEFFSTINPNLLGQRQPDSYFAPTHTSKYTRRYFRNSISKTLDEIREKNLTYKYPYLIQPLDGPWIGMDGGDIVLINDDTTVRKKLELFEWE